MKPIESSASQLIFFPKINYNTLKKTCNGKKKITKQVNELSENHVQLKENSLLNFCIKFA